MTCAKQFKTQSDFEHHVCDAIQRAKNSQVLVFKDLASPWGEKTVDSINETGDGYSTRKTYNSLARVLQIKIMPTELQDCVQSWWDMTDTALRDTGDLTSYERNQIKPRVGTTLTFRSGPYRGSQKEPDLFLRTNDDPLPSFVMESGWSESWDNLMDDVDLLLVGGDGAISAVVLLKWQLDRHTRAVSGFVELYVRDRNGMPVCRQREDVFPIPSQSPISQRLAISRREMFGSHLLPDPMRNTSPNTTVYFEIDQLRLVANQALQRMELLSA